MALATSTIAALAVAAAAAGAQAYNTRQTARRQDSAAADSIRNQSRRQRDIDAKVNENVKKLEGSNAADERAEALQSYADQLRRKQAMAGAGLDGPGGSAFQSDAAIAEQGVSDYGATNAGLLSRIDAPTMQRQGEARDVGFLGTDINLESRAAQGQSFIDDLRLRAIRRNPWIDAAATAASAYAGSMGGGAAMGGAAGAATQPGPYASGYVYQPRTW
jgi:hypothetical protein